MKSYFNLSFRHRATPTVILFISTMIPYYYVFAFSVSAPNKIARYTADNALHLDRHAVFCHRHEQYSNKLHTINANPSSSLLFAQNIDAEVVADDDGSETISVTIQRTLPNITPHKARDAWIEYHWKKGGGLPIYISSKESDGSAALDDGDAPATQECILERTILPIFMKEKAEFDGKTSQDKKSISVQYEVTEAGPFFADLVPGSHSAAVTFDGTSSGTTMTWKVDFATTRLSSLYEAVTQFTVGTAATTVQEAASTPRLFSAKTTINTSGIDSLTPEVARSACLDFVFAEGGGLPLLPPIPFGKVLPEGGGAAKENLLRIPPLLTESVIDAKTSDAGVEFTYQLNDPGLLTFPFLLHTHIGRVQFSTNDDSSILVIDWDVEMRPYKIASPLVEKLTEMTVSTILRNLRVRLTQPGAAVAIKPPRGNQIGDATRLGSVAKDTWLGGVLDAHLSDTRSTMDQTLSLIQPWIWGRSGTGDERDDVQFQWTDETKIST